MVAFLVRMGRGGGRREEVILEDLICMHTYEYTHIYNIRVYI